MTVEFPDDPETDQWIRAVYREVDEAASIGRVLRAKVARTAQDHLNRGLDPLIVAGLVWKYWQVLDIVDRLPELARQSAQIKSDSDEAEPTDSRGQGGGCGG